jgi:hypothetical protein
MLARQAVELRIEWNLALPQAAAGIEVGEQWAPRDEPRARASRCDSRRSPGALPQPLSVCSVYAADSTRLVQSLSLSLLRVTSTKKKRNAGPGCGARSRGRHEPWLDWTRQVSQLLDEEALDRHACMRDGRRVHGQGQTAIKGRGQPGVRWLVDDACSAGSRRPTRERVNPLCSASGPSAT